MRRSATLCLCALLTAPVVHAASHYISASAGNDANDGLTPATAWQSLSKINSTSFATSDSVYLKAGDTWTASGGAQVSIGWSGTASNHAVIGAYHTDANGNPVTGPGSAARPKIVSTHTFVTVTGTVSNASFAFVPAIEITGAYVDVQDIEADNWGYGLHIIGASNINVEN